MTICPSKTHLKKGSSTSCWGPSPCSMMKTRKFFRIQRQHRSHHNSKTCQCSKKWSRNQYFQPIKFQGTRSKKWPNDLLWSTPSNSSRGTNCIGNSTCYPLMECNTQSWQPPLKCKTTLTVILSGVPTMARTTKKRAPAMRPRLNRCSSRLRPSSKKNNLSSNSIEYSRCKTRSALRHLSNPRPLIQLLL